MKQMAAIICSVTIMSATLLSGLATVNIKHKPEFPKVSKNSIQCVGNLFTEKACHINLTTNIGSPGAYADIGKVLNTVGPDSKIYLHLAGYGGSVLGADYLISRIKQTGAYTIAIIEGDVYSAHANLAVSFDETRTYGNFNMLFHSNSWYREGYKQCTAQYFRHKIEPALDYDTGEVTVIETDKQYYDRARVYIANVNETDRGQSAYDKCVLTYTTIANNLQVEDLIALSNILNEEELARFDNGDDVIVDANTVIQRRSQ